MFADLPVTISSINVNSLNMSCAAKWNQMLKIYGIAKLKTDIIYLSDVRMSNKNLISAKNDIEKLLRCIPYQKYSMITNSTKNKRGVAILHKSCLDISVLHQFTPACENILAARVTLHGTQVLLIAIYGPNTVNNFFTELDNIIQGNPNVPVIIGGDWNCTLSTDRIESNPDCLNMRNLPNLTHSKKLKALCERYNLSDPYRFLLPDTREYSYVPRNILQKNRSRIDFFIVSDALLDFVTGCNISDSTQNKLFDHRAIFVEFNVKKQVSKVKKIAISNKELDDPLLEYLTHAVVCETYIIHSNIASIGRFNRDDLLQFCGRLRVQIRECGPPVESICGIDPTAEATAARQDKVGRLSILKNNLDLDSIVRSPLVVEHDIFLDILLINVKNEVVSHQSFIRKKRIEKLEWLQKRIKTLKNEPDPDMDAIFLAETQLDKIQDSEMREELEKFRFFDIINDEKMTPRFLSLAKVDKSKDSLKKIKKDNGTDFANDNERIEHIRKFYSDIYKKPAPNDTLPPGCINNFLGPEICENRIVKNSCLTNDERDFFEQDISLQ
jgi:exonuclease III